MKKLNCNNQNDLQELKTLFDRSAYNDEIDNQVKKILTDVRDQGDEAITFYSGKFDKISLTPQQFKADQSEIDAAVTLLDENMKKSIQLAFKNICDFSKQRIPQQWTYKARDGVTLGEKFIPLNRVACYIPGGTAPLISTVLHTAAIAKTAGVKEIVITTCPNAEGAIHPAILYAAKIVGATEVLKLGGVYAIGALTYGTKSIQKVDKIVGPGNAYVTSAKKHVYGLVSLDLVAGPSEILILADDSANPAFIAADMLAQAEHGSGMEQAVLVTNSQTILEAVEKELNTQKKSLSRSECIEKVIQNGIFLILTKNMNEAINISNHYAPEHLEIMTKSPEETATKITAAGAIFLGQWTPEPVGDFVAGPSHVLPTGGSANYFNGLTVDQFFKRISTIQYSENALKKEIGAIEEFAKAEGLDAHGRSATIRRDA